MSELEEIIKNKLYDKLQQDYENIHLFSLDYNMSVLPDGYHKDGKYLNYSEVRKLYDSWWELNLAKKK